MRHLIVLALFLSVIGLGHADGIGSDGAPGDSDASEFGNGDYSPATGRDYPTRLLWGDTHLHSRNSADAYSLGNMNLSPADAYRFARGQVLTAHNGQKVKLRRPLDFLVVSDHAEYLGGNYRFAVNDPLLKDIEIAKRWREYIANGEGFKVVVSFVDSVTNPQRTPPFPKPLQRTIWQEAVQTADDYNNPGTFTALPGYEWTSMINGNNLHRVVIFKQGMGYADKIAPFTAQDSTDPQALWKALEDYEQRTGGAVLAIAHNGNLSNGMMFPERTVDGKKLGKTYAQMRTRWEPLYEVSQVKGDGEAHPKLSPEDEFADYETWDKDNIGRSAAKQDWMLKHEYARSALKLGLQHQAKLGANPFKFGMIASTDGHNTFSTTEEDNFFGKFPESEPSATRMTTEMAQGALWQNWRIVASGYAAVWARENTRAAIFDAMQRREVYGTTGSRIMVRLFAGWDFQPSDIDRPNYVDIGYEKGVPMGSDLPAPPRGSVPKFLVVAAKDPIGANLDRVQIIKGWREKDGGLKEKVYDVAWSGTRQPGKDGKLPPVGSTVNVTNASYSNTIGAAQLATYWQDPDFDPKQHAFYYVRVLEIPKPRWTAYDVKYFRIKDAAKDIPMTVQDRAYSSPIWYTP
ncbi:MAG: DUF3604 domain-containing protein [Pseudomonadota bacterium]